MRISTSVDEVIERIGYTKQPPENGGAMERREVRSDIRFHVEDVHQRGNGGEVQTMDTTVVELRILPPLMR